MGIRLHIKVVDDQQRMFVDDGAQYFHLPLKVGFNGLALSAGGGGLLQVFHGNCLVAGNQMQKVGFIAGKDGCGVQLPMLLGIGFGDLAFADAAHAGKKYGISTGGKQVMDLLQFAVSADKFVLGVDRLSQQTLTAFVTA